MMIRVSVVMPFRDVEESVVAAAMSILQQDHAELELIAVDDHSTDGSVGALRGVSDRRLRLVGNDRGAGVVGAANCGIALSSGDWVLRMDADDWSHPERIRRCLELAASDPDLGVLACRARVVGSGGDGMKRYVDWVNELETPEEIAGARFVESPVINPTTMVRSDWMQRMMGYRDVEWAEDHDLWLRLLESGCRIGRVKETLVDWTDSPSRLTRTDPRYAERARNAMKAHFLAKLERVRANGAVVAGAGPIGKALARALQVEGVEVTGFFDVNPRRVGERIHGVPVAAGDQVGTHWTSSVLLGAVGLPGGREKVRRWALDAGREEGLDFWSVC